MFYQSKVIESKLSFEDAVDTYLLMYQAFKSFIETNEFSWDKYVDVYKETQRQADEIFYNNDGYERLNLINDYAFEYGDNKFTLNMNDDIDVFGYADDSDTFNVDYTKAVFCDLKMFKDSYEYDDKIAGLTFAYDKVEQKCIRILDLNQFVKNSSSDKIIVKSDGSDEFLTKILVKTDNVIPFNLNSRY